MKDGDQKKKTTKTKKKKEKEDKEMIMMEMKYTRISRKRWKKMLITMKYI